MKILRDDPREILAFRAPRFARGDATPEEEEKDMKSGFVVEGKRDRISDFAADPEFLAEFPTKGILRSLSGCDFASWELPKAAHMRVDWTLSQQYPALAVSDHSGDDDRKNVGSRGAAFRVVSTHGLVEATDSS